MRKISKIDAATTLLTNKPKTAASLPMVAPVFRTKSGNLFQNREYIQSQPKGERG